ncbi:LysR substrate-binding domain-containing protein [Acinetobacter sp. ME22]|uniref:LysR substrate-binding domain-containing protein n=1 Tax=Acinetobacter sp. ME22 TaxID=2904802 RepID=UPI001EDAAC2A|nr:LysR substrate-binding domain-containing protein [Acinetobacter sp. ME22]MCG2572060.1 LysR substrate-binding domain-containing protein [Acinetobacter sp. ME22]
MINNIEIKWLYDLIVLEKYRNFTIASDMRSISQSSLSRRIQALENNLGFELFDRETSPLQLTEKGKLFILHARNLLNDFEYNIDRIKGDNNLRSRVTIASAHSLAGYIFPKILGNLKNYKDKIFHVEAINVNETVDYLRDGRCDFIASFYDDDLMNPQFLCHKLFSAKLYLVTAPNHFMRPKFSLEDSSIPLMNYTDDSYMGKKVNKFLQDHQSELFSTTFVSSMSILLKDMIKGGYGVGWLPDYSIQEELQNNQLMIIPMKESVLSVDIYLYRSSSRLSTSSEGLWNFIKAIDWTIA